MAHIKDYLLSVIAAAMLCGIVTVLCAKNGKLSAVMRLLTGIYMSVTLCKPLLSFTPIGFDFPIPFADAAAAIVSDGENIAEMEQRRIIKEKTEAYILDKARSLGADIKAEVRLCDTAPPLPETVCISGSIAPYAKLQLAAFLTDQLDIPGEAQQWIQ